MKDLKFQTMRGKQTNKKKKKENLIQKTNEKTEKEIKERKMKEHINR
jgi:hypothetical protein